VEFARKGRWDVSFKEAVAQQRELAPLVSLADRVEAPRLVAALDLAVGRMGETGRAAVVVWRPDDGSVVESVAIERPLTIPYVPGLLAYREGPLGEEALRAVQTEPDLVLIDGHGLAHPRLFGVACHFGVLLDRPTIGVGKSRLFGRHDEPGPNSGDRAPLYDGAGEQIGVVLRTRLRSKPVYVSPGNHVSIETAADLVMTCVRGHRLPEPIFLADRLSKDRGDSAPRP
jgi:deoxyribonuclease V